MGISRPSDELNGKLLSALSIPVPEPAEELGDKAVYGGYTAPSGSPLRRFPRASRSFCLAATEPDSSRLADHCDLARDRELVCAAVQEAYVEPRGDRQPPTKGQ